MSFSALSRMPVPTAMRSKPSVPFPATDLTVTSMTPASRFATAEIAPDAVSVLLNWKSPVSTPVTSSENVTRYTIGSTPASVPLGTCRVIEMTTGPVASTNTSLVSGGSNAPSAAFWNRSWTFPPFSTMELVATPIPSASASPLCTT